MTAASRILMFDWAVPLMVYIIQLHLPVILKNRWGGTAGELTKSWHRAVWIIGGLMPLPVDHPLFLIEGDHYEFAHHPQDGDRHL